MSAGNGTPALVDEYFRCGQCDGAIPVEMLATQEVCPFCYEGLAEQCIRRDLALRVVQLSRRVSELSRKHNQLGRDLSLAESRIGQLEHELIAAGAMDLELGP
jgi:hypothetical protein